MKTRDLGLTNPVNFIRSPAAASLMTASRGVSLKNWQLGNVIAHKKGPTIRREILLRSGFARIVSRVLLISDVSLPDVVPRG
jgi:hypothetical protein